jgi:hypothetical protein
MREAFAHEAELLMEQAAASDEPDGAPGAAITVALCGHWEHDGPCPLAPHHTQAERDGAVLRVRTIFAVEPAREALVRERIESALAAGRLGTPSDQAPARWQLHSSGPSALRPEEAEHARRLSTG